MPAPRNPTHADVEQAHVQGQFQGQVLANLGDIKSKIDGVVGTVKNLDDRTRVLESRSDVLADQLRGLNENGTKAGDVMNERFWAEINSLKNWRWFVMGMAALIGFGLPLLLRYAFHLG